MSPFHVRWLLPSLHAVISVSLSDVPADSFTDTAISSKFNGQTRERELQPWDGEDTAGDALESLDGPAASVSHHLILSHLISSYLISKITIFRLFLTPEVFAFHIVSAGWREAHDGKAE